MRQLLTISVVAGLLGLALAPAVQAANFVLHEQDNDPSVDEGWTVNGTGSGQDIDDGGLPVWEITAPDDGPMYYNSAFTGDQIVAIGADGGVCEWYFRPVSGTEDFAHAVYLVPAANRMYAAMAANVDGDLVVSTWTASGITAYTLPGEGSEYHSYMISLNALPDETATLTVDGDTIATWSDPLTYTWPIPGVYFGNTNDPAFGVGNWHRVQAGTSLISEGMPGDLDGDGFVGGSDLDIIRSFWGQNVTPGNKLHGDPSGDGLVAGDDLDEVRAHWGEGTPPGAVPEPAALTLLLGAILSLCLFRRHYRPRNGNPVCS